MGSTYSVKFHDSPINTDNLHIELISLLDQVNQQMSTYIDDSELSRINRNNTNEWIGLSDDLYRVIDKSLQISKLSEGSFDITIGPVVNLWGFGPDPKPETIPSNTLIRKTLNSVGYKNLLLRNSPHAIKKNSNNIFIDLSGIAKGYAVDKLAHCLDQNNINNYLVEIGGELKAKGLNIDGVPWRIGIEKPEENKRSVQRIIRLQNTAMATSGDYRNYFEENGIRYSHTIDPKTGRPITHKLVSVTVIHPEAMVADGMSTALLVMGPENGFILATKMNLAVLFIVRDKDGYKELMTEKFRQIH